MIRKMTGCIGLLALLAATTPVRGDLLYGVDTTSDSFYTVDSVSGAVVVIGKLHPDSDRYTTPVAMAVRKSDGAIFVINNSPTSDEGLSTVNPLTGLATHIGIGGAGYGQALAFDTSGNLYAPDTNVGLIKIDPLTGFGTSVGGGPLPEEVQGLDFNAADGYLYGLSTNFLLVIDPSNAMLVSTIPLSPGIVGAPQALVFLGDGTLIGSDLGTRLFDIDPATGTMSNFRTVGLGLSPQGLGLATPVPEPSTIALLAIGGLGLFGSWYRRKRSVQV